MGQALKNNLTVISLSSGIIVGVFGAIQAYAVLPYRVVEMEQKIKMLEEDQRQSREILIRIEERVKRVQEDLRK
jgi:hypothetical protein